MITLAERGLACLDDDGGCEAWPWKGASKVESAERTSESERSRLPGTRPRFGVIGSTPSFDFGIFSSSCGWDFTGKPLAALISG